jgi:thiol-disulfide isomerase/thioredoxin
METNQVSESPERPKSSYRHLVWAGLFMLCGLTFLIFLGRERARIVGQPLLDLELRPLLHADRELLPNELRGKVVVLHFWGPWCAPCRSEYPEITQLQSQHRDHPEVRIVSIACGATSPEDVPELQLDTEKMLAGIDDVARPVYCDPAEFSRVQVAKLFQQRGFAYPTTLLLDRKGRVVDYWIGASRPGEIAAAVAKELARPRLGT